jgi:hypothetical protein
MNGSKFLFSYMWFQENIDKLILQKGAYQQYIKSQSDKDQFSSSDNEGNKKMMNPRLSMN